MSITIVQLKEYRQHCINQKSFFNEQLLLKSLPEQREGHLEAFKYYQKEVDRMNKKIENYPL